MNKGADNSLIISYLTLRQTIGVIGLLMPIVVRLGAKLIQGVAVVSTGSISAYYYTNMHDVFISSLILTGVLMACYRSRSPLDTHLSVVIGAFAIGIALFPMNPEFSPEIRRQHLDVIDRTCYLFPPFAYAHLACATAFFILCFYLVYFRFRAFTPPSPTRQKVKRNRVYQFCGIVILAMSIIIGIFLVMKRGGAIFWPETAAVIAFGFAWLVKGQTFWKDPPLVSAE